MGEQVELALRRDDTWSTRVGGAGIMVRCLTGMIWVTREGDWEDHILAAGASLASDRPGRLALMALEPAHVQVTSARGAAAEPECEPAADARLTPTG